MLQSATGEDVQLLLARRPARAERGDRRLRAARAVARALPCRGPARARRRRGPRRAACRWSAIGRGRTQPDLLAPSDWAPARRSQPGDAAPVPRGRQVAEQRMTVAIQGEAGHRQADARRAPAQPRWRRPAVGGPLRPARLGAGVGRGGPRRWDRDPAPGPCALAAEAQLRAVRPPRRARRDRRGRLGHQPDQLRAPTRRARSCSSRLARVSLLVPALRDRCTTCACWSTTGARRASEPRAPARSCGPRPTRRSPPSRGRATSVSCTTRSTPRRCAAAP